MKWKLASPIHVSLVENALRREMLGDANVSDTILDGNLSYLRNKHYKSDIYRKCLFCSSFCGLNMCEVEPCLFGKCELTATGFKVSVHKFRILFFCDGTFYKSAIDLGEFLFHFILTLDSNLRYNFRVQDVL